MILVNDEEDQGKFLYLLKSYITGNPKEKEASIQPLKDRISYTLDEGSFDEVCKKIYSIKFHGELL